MLFFAMYENLQLAMNWKQKVAAYVSLLESNIMIFLFDDADEIVR